MNETAWNLNQAAKTNKTANKNGKLQQKLLRFDYPRELAKNTGRFEPLPTHNVPLKDGSNTDVNRNTGGLICVIQLSVVVNCIAYVIPSH